MRTQQVNMPRQGMYSSRGDLDLKNVKADLNKFKLTKMWCLSVESEEGTAVSSVLIMSSFSGCVSHPRQLAVFHK